MLDECFIGTDIVSVPNIERLLNKYHEKFRQHTFTKVEIDYCDSRPRSAEHFAGRFAAKEAVKKALMSAGIAVSPSLKKIEIIPEPDGRPSVNLHFKTNEKIVCRVSISHIPEYAVAAAIVQKESS